jgi:apolipoprotein N-acyltransferase
MKKRHFILLSLLSGLLLTLAWPARGFPGLLFIGFVPLLIIEEQLFRNREKKRRFSALFYSYPAFLIFNGLTTWWIWNSTGIGAILAIVLNALFMAIVFNLFHYTRQKLRNNFAGYSSLIFYWIAFEYLHLNWDLNWPWLNLGNGFGTFYNWVQWYEYTGALGGTLWVLAANILIFLITRPYFFKDTISVPKFRISLLSITLPWILLPIMISYMICANYQEEKHPVKFVIVQPNLDPYNEQYVLPPKQVVGMIMELAKPLLDSSTNFLIAPESAIQESMWENELNTFMSVKLLKDILPEYPNLNILIGGSTFRYFNKGEQISSTARQFTDTKEYFDAFNTAILVNKRDSLQLYHKSKLTPGVEILPSFRNFKWIEKFAIDLGGTVGSLGMDKFRKVYTTVNTVRVSPAICYESIFGEFFAEFVRNGAQVMIIITNDGWWGNSPGHRQHFAFASLRAIETRRSIARSANTGISAFIDQRGDIFQPTEYWKPAVIKKTLNANSKLTFYVRHGDFLARVAVFIGGLLFFLSIIIHFFFKKVTLNS